eukprot:s3761_g5.t1
MRQDLRTENARLQQQLSKARNAVTLLKKQLDDATAARDRERPLNNATTMGVYRCLELVNEHFVEVREVAEVAEVRVKLGGSASFREASQLVLGGPGSWRGGSMDRSVSVLGWFWLVVLVALVVLVVPQVPVWVRDVWLVLVLVLLVLVLLGLVLLVPLVLLVLLELLVLVVMVGRLVVLAVLVMVVGMVGMVGMRGLVGMDVVIAGVGGAGGENEMAVVIWGDVPGVMVLMAMVVTMEI